MRRPRMTLLDMADAVFSAVFFSLFLLALFFGAMIGF